MDLTYSAEVLMVEIFY